MYVYTHIWICIHICMYIYLYVSIYLSIYLYIYIYVERGFVWKDAVDSTRAATHQACQLFTVLCSSFLLLSSL